MSRRDRNTPEAITDNAPTVRASLDETVHVERVIAAQARRCRARFHVVRWLVIGGAFSGYVALVLELWRR